MGEKISATRLAELNRRRYEESIEKLVREVKAGEAEGLADLDRESGASPYREAEELARDLYRGR